MFNRARVTALGGKVVAPIDLGRAPLEVELSDTSIVAGFPTPFAQLRGEGRGGARARARAFAAPAGRGSFAP